jgi:hypothetical protein
MGDAQKEVYPLLFYRRTIEQTCSINRREDVTFLNAQLGKTPNE